jgi:uncharacterized protein (UPF0335 family)
MGDPLGNSIEPSAAKRLRSLIERVERLDDERKSLGDDRKDVMAEAKSAGYDMKAFRELLRRRKKDPSEVEELDQLVETYERALQVREATKDL